MKPIVFIYNLILWKIIASLNLSIIITKLTAWTIQKSSVQREETSLSEFSSFWDKPLCLDKDQNPKRNW